jgi:hypothetical protein
MCQSDADMVRNWRDGERRRAIAINNTYQLAPWADVLYACDLRWWDRYFEDASSRCRGEFWCHHQKAESKYGLNRWKPERTGGNSGYQALRLAIDHFGAGSVILLGYDMQGSHWHGEHKGFPNPTADNFRQWVGWLRHYAAETDAEIINASRETAVDCFPQMPLEDALSDRVAT